jgi:hypothetical protein
MGVPLMVEWVKAPIPTFPERSHRRLHGTRVAPGGMFVIESGEDAGASAPFPGKFGIARQDINCRCRTKPILLDDEDED